MHRTVINISNSDKKWLKKQAQLRKIPMTKIVREAICFYRTQLESENKPSFEDLLKQTIGLWQKGDGLDNQTKIREEWD